MRTLAIGLSPNTSYEDYKTALYLLRDMVVGKRMTYVTALEAWFKTKYSSVDAIAFAKARDGLYAILSSLDIKKGDEIILQAFTCVVVPNAIIARDATPVYVDIDETLTLNILDLEKKITKNTRAIIVQHTFGIPASMEKIMQIAKKYNIYVIEDVAHVIGGEYKAKKLGTFGIASIFSFGRDKAFSSVFGGIVSTSDKKLAEKLRSFQKKQKRPSTFWTLQQLFHPLLSPIIVFFYDSSIIGKGLLICLQKLHILSLPMTREEITGNFRASTIRQYPEALAGLALSQLRRLEPYNKQRRMQSLLYDRLCKKLKIKTFITGGATLLRYPIYIANPRSMRSFFRMSAHIYLGNWYAHIIDPKKTNLKNIQYTTGSCRVAEDIASHICNLPLLPNATKDENERIVQILTEYIKQ